MTEREPRLRRPRGGIAQATRLAPGVGQRAGALPCGRSRREAFGQLIAAVFPVLDHFDIDASVTTGFPVPIIYLLAALGYCLLYSTVAMLLALVLFEDRDLA